MHFLWVILIGLIAGIIAKFIVPGEKNEPKGLLSKLDDRSQLSFFSMLMRVADCLKFPAAMARD